MKNGTGFSPACIKGTMFERAMDDFEYCASEAVSAASWAKEVMTEEACLAAVETAKKALAAWRKAQKYEGR